MGALLVVGRLIGRVDTRLLLGTGLALTAWSFYAMTGWTPDISQTTIIAVGLIQGIGLGLSSCRSASLHCRVVREERVSGTFR
jgi:MFS transporter, DHA2 family, multidrug resistance protein